MVTICLNMIVKNESKIIKRLFDSVYKIIDYWVIVDTGSTDETKEIIINYFKEKNIPGELHEDKYHLARLIRTAFSPRRPAITFAIAFRKMRG